jgi:hypothetical protein
MVKKIEYETPFDRFRRERNEKICQEYLDRSSDILNEGVSPNRVMTYIGSLHHMTAYNVKKILIAKGIFVDKTTPVVFPEWYNTMSCLP